jgi:hypothetical protein
MASKARQRLLKMVQLCYLELLLTGNDLNKQGIYSYFQHKQNAWAGGSLDVIDGRNGNIAVSCNFPEYFQDTEYIASLHIFYFLFNSVIILCMFLKEECLFSYMALYFLGFHKTK